MHLLCVAEEPVEFIRHLQDQTVTEIPTEVTLECELSKANVKVHIYLLVIKKKKKKKKKKVH